MIDPLRDVPLVRDGYRKGVREGEARGQAKTLLMMLEERGFQVSEATRKQILATTDKSTLTRWIRNAMHASSAAEVLA